MILDKTLLDNLLEQAAENPRLRQNLDLRNQSLRQAQGKLGSGLALPEDNSQRMLNALLPGTVLPIHRHTKTSETVVILRGKMEEIFYEENPLRETGRVLLEAGGEVQGLSIPVGQWHTVNVLEPTVILECKDGKYEPLGKEDMIEN